MLKWIEPSEWKYGSKTLNMRQHHAGGVLNMYNMLIQHFGVLNFYKLQNFRFQN